MTNEQRIIVREYIDAAVKAAAEAYSVVAEASGDSEAAVFAARTAFRNNLPTLESGTAVMAYLAVVVRGMELELIDGYEGRNLMQVARLWLQADRLVSA